MAEIESMETSFRAKRAAGRKLLVPYVTGGLPGWADAVRACAANGADAVEIGLPFSDPVMDGPVIQEASQLALDGGATPVSILHEARELEVGIPLAVMTYYNIVYRAGHERFAEQLISAGISAAILPDLPLEESGPWCETADAAGVETVMFAAPTAPDARLPRICARARGFVYSGSGPNSPRRRRRWPNASRRSPTSRYSSESACRTRRRPPKPARSPTE
jgi:tryptophan synthase alpha chain